MTPTTANQRPTQTGGKKLYRHDVTCSHCGYRGEVDMRRKR